MRLLKWSLICSVFLFSCQGEPTRTESQLSAKEVRIEYIAHACFLLETSEATVMLDPYADKVWLGYEFSRGIQADAVFITHPHYDHDGGIFRGKRPDWMFTTPFYQNPKEYEVGNFSIKGVIGKHADPYGKEFGQMNTFWKIEVNGIVFTHWGDNGPLTQENVVDLKGTDVLFIPMDGDFHIISKRDYEEVLNALKPSIVVPMHYRIPELEPTEESPKNLGEVEPFLKQRPEMISENQESSYLPRVKYLLSNQVSLSKEELPDSTEYWVFEHSPLIPIPNPNILP